MPWHGWDPILKKLRLKDLRRNGYIDTDKDWKTIDRRVAIPTDQEVFDEIDNDALHPVFKQANWRGITDQDFARLRPALRLASNLLFEPTILQFFTGLMRTPLPEITNFPLATVKYGKPAQVYCSASLWQRQGRPRRGRCYVEKSFQVTRLCSMGVWRKQSRCVGGYSSYGWMGSQIPGEKGLHNSVSFTVS